MATNFVRPYQFQSGVPGNLFGRVRVSFRMTALEDLDLTMIARVISATPDSNLENNIDSQVTEVTGVADLSISKSASAELQVPGAQSLPYDIFSAAPFPEAPDFAASTFAVTAGRRIRYTLEVNNDGPSDAENVVVSDRLPSGVRVVPGSLVITGVSSGSCQFGTPGDPDDKMTCGLGTLVDPVEAAATPAPNPPVSDSATIQFDVIADTDLSVGTVLGNSAFVSSDTADIDNSNNVDGELTVVGPLVGVSGCSVGGPYNNVICNGGSATIGLSGFGFAVPGGPITYSWATDCPGAAFSDATVSSPDLSFTTANPDNSPVSCQVSLEVQNAFAQSTCSAPVTVVDCLVDCNGVLGGSAELDRCGACQGDGTSCLGCKEVDFSAEIKDYLTSALRLRTLALRSGAALLGASGAKAKASRIRNRARKQFREAVRAASTLDPKVTTCSNTVFCVQTSNVSNLTVLGDTLEDLNQTVIKGVNQLRRAAGNRAAKKRTLRRAKESAGLGQAALTRMPLQSSSCS